MRSVNWRWFGNEANTIFNTDNRISTSWSVSADHSDVSLQQNTATVSFSCLQTQRTYQHHQHAGVISYGRSCPIARMPSFDIPLTF